ncbi:MAG TPA: hypothetical protein VE567_01775 [Sphingomonas sp.]|nr:hypothetical protein [Sphingomonas sp.]
MTTRGQRQDGSTINATVSYNSNLDQVTYAFANPFSMQINLSRATFVTVNGSGLGDLFNLMNSSSVTINGGKGNDIFSVSAMTGSLVDNVVRGNLGVDFITLNGSNSNIDLAMASGIEAVVGRRTLTGQTLSLKLDQLAASTLTDGGSGRAFAAVLGGDGNVNLALSGKFQLLGTVDQAGNGFDANGNAITGSALAALQSRVTSISSVTGNLATLYANTAVVPANETTVGSELSAYVFSDGIKAYTLWTDATITATDAKGVLLPSYYNPDAATPATPPSYGFVDTFDKNGAFGVGTISVDPNDLPTLKMGTGTVEGVSAILLRAEVTGIKVAGDSGANGINWFGIGTSGGGNEITGSKVGNIFDLQTSTALIDQLVGGKGFDVVKAGASGADVDLTGLFGPNGKASSGIDAVVGSLNDTQTVELDVSKLRIATDATGAHVASFTALLGSSADTLTLSGAGKWAEIATFKPGEPLPDHAVALSNTGVLNDLFASSKHTAENSLDGHLFAQVNSRGDVVKYVTVYTDATIDNHLAVGTASLTTDYFHFA